ERRVGFAAGDSRADRRLSDRRRDLPLAVGRELVYAYAGPARGDALEFSRCERAAAHGDPLRRPGAFSRAQAPLPRAVRARALSGTGFCDSFWKSEDGAAGERHHAGDVWRAGAARAA